MSSLVVSTMAVYEFMATEVPAPDCVATLHSVRVHRGWVGVAVGARIGCQGRRRTHVQADDQMGTI